MLLKLAVAQCYADALVSLPDQVKEADADAFYKLWPSALTNTSDEIAQAAIAIHTELAGRPIYRCTTRSGVNRVTLPELDVLPAGVEPSLIQALLAENYCIPDPALPLSIVEAAQAADLELHLVSRI